MSALTEAFLDTFDSNAQITWTLAGPLTAIASFAASGSRVVTTFSGMSDEWRASVEVVAGQDATTQIAASIRILRGIFQSVREFLEVRQPMRLIFPSKDESLGWLYETYLKRQNTVLAQLGYEMVARRWITVTRGALRGEPGTTRDPSAGDLANAVSNRRTLNSIPIMPCITAARHVAYERFVGGISSLKPVRYRGND